MIAREGYSVVASVFVITAILIAVGYWAGGYWFLVSAILGTVFFLFTLYFFRDPKRVPPENADRYLIAPADGKVILVKDVDHHDFMGGACKQISIFLSPLDVHVNYVPVAGKLEYLKYHPGKYLVAWHEKASELNERSEFGVVHPGGKKFFFKQITGYVARRIVYDLQKGQDVYAGQRFGMMKFGSRMDILVPEGFRILVKPGDRTIAAESVMGEIG
jgi:phosphatidylserine decarboxylase